MLNSIKNILSERKGSQIVETAIFLPIFIIGIMTLGYLVKFNAVQENVFHSFADEIGKIAAEANLNIAAPLFYENDVENRIKKENVETVIDTDISNFKYRIPGYVNDNVISASVGYNIDVDLPLGFIHKIPVSDTIICRAFVGDEQQLAPMPFSEMEKSTNSGMIWIFPRSGTRYHHENCSYIKNYPKEMILSHVIKNRYNPCAICHPTDLKDGSLAYCFSTGSVYHKGECATVTKYVTSMDKIEAQNRGYAACLRCGGD